VSTPRSATRRVQLWQRLDDELPQLSDAEEDDDIVWQHLRAEFKWYHSAATGSRLGYQILKTVSLVVAAVVPVLAAIDAPPGWTAALAAVVIVLEAVQQLYQLHTKWITYRSTAEALRQLAFRYAARVGPYKDAETRREILAEEVHALVSEEGGRWASTMREAPVAPAPSPGP
jgi:hypothetical protein